MKVESLGSKVKGIIMVGNLGCLGEGYKMGWSGFENVYEKNHKAFI